MGHLDLLQPAHGAGVDSCRRLCSVPGPLQTLQRAELCVWWEEGYFLISFSFDESSDRLDLPESTNFLPTFASHHPHLLVSMERLCPMCLLPPPHIHLVFSSSFVTRVSNLLPSLSSSADCLLISPPRAVLICDRSLVSPIPGGASAFHLSAFISSSGIVLTSSVLHQN